MNKTKILKIKDDVIYFDNGFELSSNHEQDCCEKHYLDFKHIDKEDYQDLSFDLSNDNFFTRIPDYGIQLNPINNHPLRIPGYGYNNGYYTDNLSLVLKTDNGRREYDITSCQVIEG